MIDLQKQGFEAQARALQEFGYSTVTADDVAEAHRKWKAGEGAAGIIEMFCFDAFSKHPEVFK